MVNEQNDEDDRELDAEGDPGGGPGGEGDPEGLSGGRIPAPPIPRDEWVENVIDDPASNTRPVLLQGYVGDAAEEDYTRIYPDASLGSYVDVRNEDVLYHLPLDGDQQPRGGSMVWVRGDAQVSQGTAPAAGADFFTGPVLAQNRQAGAAGAAQPAGPVHITLLTIAGCITQGIYCPPRNTAATLCTQRIICSHVCQQPGGVGGQPWQGGLGGHIDATTGCPPSVVDYCPTKPKPCGQFELPGDRWQPQLMRAAADVGPTGYQGCGQEAGGEQGPIGVTGWQGCGQGPIGVTGWQGCGQPHISLPGCVHTGICISLPGCVQTGTCGTGQEAGGGQGPIGVTGWQGCGQPHISLPGCVHTGTCPQAEAVTGPGSTIATVCTQIGCPHSGVANCSIATVCTQIGCHTAPQHCIPSLSGCPNNTLATVCTQIGCPVGGAQGPIGPTGWQGCGQPHISLPGCIHTGTCPQAEAQGGPIGRTGWLGCGQATHMLGCTGATAVTVCYCGPGPVSMHPGCPSPQLGAAGGSPLTMGGICGPGPVSMHPGCPSPQIGAAGGGPIGQTGWLGCGHPGTIGPTGWLHCGHTLATVCTFHCPPPLTMGGICGPGPVQTVVAHCPSAVDACPTRVCGGGGGEQVNPQAMMAAAPGGGTTAATVCTQLGCRHTGYGCPRTSTCPPTFTPGCGPETERGGSTAATLCTQTPFCPLTFQCLPVTLTPGCGPQMAAGPAGTAATLCTRYGCGHPGGTAATVCTQFGCGPEQMAGPAGTAATLCTRYGCGHPGGTAATVCTQLGCGGAEMKAAAPEGAAGIPTGQYSPACPSFGFTCTYVHCPPITATATATGGTAATVCTQVGGCGGGGGSTLLGCPRTISCPPTYTPGCGGGDPAAAPQGAAALPTYSPACPTFGFTCTYIHCSPAVGAAGPQGAAAIPTGQYSPACPSFGFTCTVFC